LAKSKFPKTPFFEPFATCMLCSMKVDTLVLSRTRANGVAAVVILALSLGALWAAVYGLHTLSPFNYERLQAALCISIAVIVVGLGVYLVLPRSEVASFFAKSPVIKAAGWLSVVFALDSMLIEPCVGSVFPRLNLGYSLRWQFQLIIAGLLALMVAITKRSWRWIPFSVLATAFGFFWLLMILVPE
jgi:hypothetical protein